jgi:hypothetical protein
VRRSPIRQLLALALLGALHLLTAGCGTTRTNPIDRADYDHLMHPAAAFAFFRDTTLEHQYRDAWETLSDRMRGDISYASFSRAVSSPQARPHLDRLRRARFVEHVTTNASGTRTRVTLEVDDKRYRFPMILTRRGWQIDIDPQQLLGGSGSPAPRSTAGSTPGARAAPP